MEDEDEGTVRRRLAALDDEGSADYIALLNDLADLVLAKGDVQEAQQMFDKARRLRSTQMADEAQAASQEASAPASAAPQAACGAHDVPDDWETAFDLAGRAATAAAASTSTSAARRPPAGSGSAQQRSSAHHQHSGSAGVGLDHSPPRRTTAAAPAPFLSPAGRSIPAATATAPSGRDGVGSRAGSVQPASFASSPKVASSSSAQHVLEVYGLNKDIKAQHLEEFVDALCPKDGRPIPVVRWVDDQHALLVCNSAATATVLLEEEQDLFRLRPFAEACEASRNMAPGELLPPRERPKTTTAVARRLLSHHLGMRELRDKDAEAELAAQRKAKKDAQKEREAQLAAAWGDD